MLKFEQNVPISKLTTLQIGGPAKLFVAVKTEKELIEAIQYAIDNDIDYMVIGGGSNLLVNDRGVDKLIIKNGISGINYTPPRSNFVTPRRWPPRPAKPWRSGDGLLRGEEMRLHLGGVISVKSGTILQDLVDYTIHHGLAGLHKLTGIPGTVGGAVYGNAGAYGQTISDHIIEVVALDGENIITLSKDQCDFNYRDSGFKRNKYTILEIHFQGETGDPKTLEQEAKDVLSKRLVKYPKGIRCPGSFFKNIVASSLSEEILKQIPPDKITYGKLSAGYLLETVGAQGQRLDGIEIANYHANLFVNKGSGTAKAFYNLAQTYAQKVKQKFGITLEPEVQLINLPPL